MFEWGGFETPYNREGLFNKPFSVYHKPGFHIANKALPNIGQMMAGSQRSASFVIVK